mmetsp:Transcript_106853/g.319457  ORF Transcript_106853/g.319457 Transcript_106853/m.319457 type:complete len:213 (-) Transcript_106853:85-723(-)
MLSRASAPLPLSNSRRACSHRSPLSHELMLAPSVIASGSSLTSPIRSRTRRSRAHSQALSSALEPTTSRSRPPRSRSACRATAACQLRDLAHALVAELNTTVPGSKRHCCAPASSAAATCHGPAAPSQAGACDSAAPEAAATAQAPTAAPQAMTSNSAPSACRTSNTPRAPRHARLRPRAVTVDVYCAGCRGPRRPKPTSIVCKTEARAASR